MNKGMVVGLFLAGWVLSGVAAADEFYVDGTAGSDSYDGRAGAPQGGSVGPKATIRAGLEAASAGDRVTVADGTYVGAGNRDLDFSGQAITLRSANGAANCIIDCQGGPGNAHRGFVFETAEGADSVVEGFTVRGGFGLGGAIYAFAAAPTIRDCILTDNTGDGKGGAVACDQGGITLRGCTVSGNAAPDGGALYADAATAVIIDCVISDNATTGVNPNGNGGAISAESGSTVTISRSEVTGNRALNVGGGMYLLGSTAALDNCLLAGNWGESHGGGIYCWDSAISLVNCTVTENAASYNGGAVRVWGQSECAMVNGIVWGNAYRRPEGLGAQIAIAEGGSLGVASSDVQGGQSGVGSDPVGVSITWGAGNIEEDPLFGQAGEWDDNGTPDDPGDDVWTAGDYAIMSSAACINGGDNGAAAPYSTDLAGNPRISGGAVDLGAYENNVLPLTVNKLSIKAGKTRDPQSPLDSFVLLGTFAGEYPDLGQSASLRLRVGLWLSGPINRGDFKQTPGKPIYSYSSKANGIKSLKIDLVKGVLMATGKNADLTGLAAPVSVELVVNGYRALGGADDSGDADVINSAKPVPIQLLSGYADALRVDKASATEAAGAVGSLSVQGGIAALELPDFTVTGVTVYWGAAQYTIGPEYFLPSSTAGKFTWKKKGAAGSESSGSGLFDFNKGVFKVSLKNTPMPWQESATRFGLAFDGFSETAAVP